MCNCKNAQVGKVRKSRKRRRASVGALSITKPKDMLNAPTLGAAGFTVFGLSSIDKVTEEKSITKLTSTNEGGKYLTILGTVGAFLIPGKGTGAKIFRGVAAGAALHGAKVWLTDADWMGNANAGETMDSVAGWPYIPGQRAYNGNPVNGGARNKVRYA